MIHLMEPHKVSSMMISWYWVVPGGEFEKRWFFDRHFDNCSVGDEEWFLEVDSGLSEEMMKRFCRKALKEMEVGGPGVGEG